MAHGLDTLKNELRHLVFRIGELRSELFRGTELTRFQEIVLSDLRTDGPASIPELARRRGVTNAIMVSQVGHLQAAGLVDFKHRVGRRRPVVVPTRPPAPPHLDDYKAYLKDVTRTIRREGSAIIAGRDRGQPRPARD